MVYNKYGSFYRIFLCLLPQLILLLFEALTIMKLIPLSGILSVVIYGTIYTILYIFSGYIFVINDYERKIINSLKGKVIKNGKNRDTLYRE